MKLRIFYQNTSVQYWTSLFADFRKSFAFPNLKKRLFFGTLRKKKRLLFDEAFVRIRTDCFGGAIINIWGLYISFFLTFFLHFSNEVGEFLKKSSFFFIFSLYCFCFNFL